MLIYAVNRDARHHDDARAWLDSALGGADVVGLSRVVLLAFVQARHQAGVVPATADRAGGLPAGAEVDERAPGAVIASSGQVHAAYLLETLESLGVAGNLVNDAHLAALAREHRAEIVSYDSDLDRFVGVRRHDPGNLLG